MIVKKIFKLSDLMVAQISAGEVVESPAGVLKELLDNSIDADATDVVIHVNGDGFDLIQVTDNGNGILMEDLVPAMTSFHTSKISKPEDLLRIGTLGFRGEALGAIRSVSRVTLESRTGESEQAWKISAEAEYISDPEPGIIPNGTRIRITDLFYNSPVRREFQSNQRRLLKDMTDMVTDFSLAYPQKSFRFFSDNEIKLNLTSVKNLTERLKQLFSIEFSHGLIPLYRDQEGVAFRGYISGFQFYRNSPSLIRFFVNNRQVKYPRLVGLLRSVYGELMQPGRFPVAFIFSEVLPENIDINIHPQKKEIRFKNEDKFYELLRSVLLRAIEGRGVIAATRLQNPAKPVFKSSENDNDTQTFNLPINWEPETHEHLEKESPFERFEMPFPEMAHARLFKTFVIASSSDGLFLIDQHTAHERINYEKFLNSLTKQEGVKQYLTQPLPVRLTPAEKEIMKKEHHLFGEMGFDLEDLGPAGFVLNSVPYYIESGEEENALFILLQQLANKNQDRLSAIMLFDSLAKDLSCRNAIRKGDDESVPNLQDLITGLSKCRRPSRCPHGRPTMIFLGKTDLFGLFKRKI